MNVVKKDIEHARCEVLTAVLLNVQVFWDVMLCRLVTYYQRSEGSQCINLQLQAAVEEKTDSS
jgi:hypothetical protein